jgi:hypothetical protein
MSDETEKNVEKTVQEAAGGEIPDSELDKAVGGTSKVQYKFVEPKPSGGSGGDVIASWDVTTNKKV